MMETKGEQSQFMHKFEEMIRTDSEYGHHAQLAMQAVTEAETNFLLMSRDVVVTCFALMDVGYRIPMPWFEMQNAFAHQYDPDQVTIVVNAFNQTYIIRN